MAEASVNPSSAPAILLVLTSVSGIVDAVSFLVLGHVFTANMTGNVVFLGFALGGAQDISISRSILAIVFFLIGAGAGARMTMQMTAQNSRQRVVRVFVVEALLLLVAAAIAMWLNAPYPDHPTALYGIVATTAVAMGMRNAVVRKLGVPDLTTTVLTLTIAGIAANSALAGGDNVRIGSSDGDCAPSPSHTTGRAVFRIRRLNPASHPASWEGTTKP
jgi:uncharacterized membrane protein YoaK (UPF0700 family)